MNQIIKNTTSIETYETPYVLRNPETQVLEDLGKLRLTILWGQDLDYNGNDDENRKARGNEVVRDMYKIRPFTANQMIKVVEQNGVRLASGFFGTLIVEKLIHGWAREFGMFYKLGAHLAVDRNGEQYNAISFARQELTRVWHTVGKTATVQLVGYITNDVYRTQDWYPETFGVARGLKSVFGLLTPDTCKIEFVQEAKLRWIRHNVAKVGFRVAEDAKQMEWNDIPLVTGKPIVTEVVLPPKTQPTEAVTLPVALDEANTLGDRVDEVEKADKPIRLQWENQNGYRCRNGEVYPRDLLPRENKNRNRG